MGCTIEVEDRNFVLEYLAEGAANVVFKLRPYHPKLLRFRKAPSKTPYSEIVHHFNTVLSPLFPSDALVQPTLFKIPDVPLVISALNQVLLEKEADGSRSKKRRGVYLTPSEEYGILVQDMTPRQDQERFFEFKPKWLVQSPSAPARAKRCRTCALREMRRAAHVVSGRGDRNFCPLDLLSTQDTVLDEVLGLIVGDDLEALKPIFKEKIQPLLSRLRVLQVTYSHVGLDDLNGQQMSTASRTEGDEGPESSATGTLFDVLIGMTIRDCSVFVRYNTDKPKTEAEVKLADLDMKSARLEKWADIERQLISGGWYTGDEIAAEDGGRRRRRFCRALQGG
jgi:inositol-pentakisphosphate 2-kinase